MNQVYRLPMQFFKRAMSNPMGIFVYGILSKWYAIIMITTVITTYWVFKGLEKAGVLDKINHQLKIGFSQVQSVAQNCTPLILNVDALWNCVQNPPEYVPTDFDQALIKGVEQDVKANADIAASGSWDRSKPQHNPYDDDEPATAAPPTQ